MSGCEPVDLFVENHQFLINKQVDLALWNGSFSSKDVDFNEEHASLQKQWFEQRLLEAIGWPGKYH